MRPFPLTVLLLTVSTALAQEDLRIDESKLYATAAGACADLENHGVRAWETKDFRVLTFADGIQSMEFHCGFYDRKSLPGSSKLFISAICEMPGRIYPDTLAIVPDSENTILVASSTDSLYDMQADAIEPAEIRPNGPGVTIYHRCDNLSEIPRD